MCACVRACVCARARVCVCVWANFGVGMSLMCGMCFEFLTGVGGGGFGGEHHAMGIAEGKELTPCDCAAGCCHTSHAKRQQVTSSSQVTSITSHFTKHTSQITKTCQYLHTKSISHVQPGPAAAAAAAAFRLHRSRSSSKDCREGRHGKGEGILHVAQQLALSGAQ